MHSAYIFRPAAIHTHFDQQQSRMDNHNASIWVPLMFRVAALCYGGRHVMRRIRGICFLRISSKIGQIVRIAGLAAALRQLVSPAVRRKEESRRWWNAERLLWTSGKGAGFIERSPLR